MSESSTFRQDIQGLRGVAVILVVIFHAGVTSFPGFVGVDIFFVISGFVISSSISSEIGRTGHFSLRHFLRRRFWRLFPTLAVVVSAVLVLSYVFGPVRQVRTVVETSLAALIGVSNLYFGRQNVDYFASPQEENPLLHSWSLGVEAQFYVVFGLLVFAYFARLSANLSIRRQVLIALMGLLFLLSIAATIFGFGLLTSDHFFDPITRVWEFGAGVLAFLGSRKLAKANPPSWTLNLAGLTGIALIGVSLVILDPILWPDNTALPLVSGTVLVMLAGTQRTGFVSRLLSFPLLTWLGQISYSFYLWHWPGLVFARQISDTPLDLDPKNFIIFAGLTVSFLVSIATYYLVENRFRYSSGPKGNTSMQFLGVMALPLFPLLTLGGLVASGYVSNQISQWHSSEEWEAWANCNAHPPDYALENGDPISSSDCLFGPFGSGKKIFVLGDSTAGALSSGFIGAGEALNRPVIVSTGSGCTPFPRGYACDQYVERLIRHLEENETHSTIVFSFGAYVGNAGDVARDSLAEKVNRLTNVGHEVLLVLPPFTFDKDPNWEAWGCSLLELDLGLCPRVFSTLEAGQGDLLTRSLVFDVEEVTEARVISLDAELCPSGECDHFSKNLRKYADAIHISEEWSKALAPAIAREIENRS